MKRLERHMTIVHQVTRKVHGGRELFRGLGQRHLSDWDIQSLWPRSPAGQSNGGCYRFCYSFLRADPGILGREAGTDAR